MQYELWTNEQRPECLVFLVFIYFSADFRYDNVEFVFPILPNSCSPPPVKVKLYVYDYMGNPSFSTENIKYVSFCKKNLVHNHFAVSCTYNSFKNMFFTWTMQFNCGIRSCRVYITLWFYSLIFLNFFPLFIY